jgi:transcriptional regulator with XRE-family HTH domain
MNSEKTANKNQGRRSMQEILVVLGKRIRRERNQNGFSQEGFATECGLHRTEMGSLERARRFRDWTRYCWSLSISGCLFLTYYKG